MRNAELAPLEIYHHRMTIYEWQASSEVQHTECIALRYL